MGRRETHGGGGGGEEDDVMIPRYTTDDVRGWQARSVRGMDSLNRLDATDTLNAWFSGPTSTLISQTNNKYLTVRMRVGVTRPIKCCSRSVL